MSINAIEKLMWQVNSSRAESERYRDNPEAFMADYRLDEEERALLLSWDVGALVNRGVNPMVLMMAFSEINGREKLTEYLAKIHDPAVVGAAG